MNIFCIFDELVIIVCLNIYFIYIIDIKIICIEEIILIDII